MKFLVDNQLPAALARWLSAKGFEAAHVLDLELNESDDERIWAHAAAQRMVVISKDDDFQNRATHRGTVQVVWVRLGNCRNQALLDTFERQLPAVISALENGVSVVELWPPVGLESSRNS